jgi:hypothetical protein
VTIDLKEFNRLKTEIEKLRTKADKAEGALEQTMKTLKEDYDCDTIEEAQDLAKSKRKKEEKLKAKFQNTHDEFVGKWGEKLRSDE